ncbi:peroxisome biogenesis factor 2-like [Physella acuta]|uniref:peroxisome biogenesis factor 2-like n=1 Tax=Physella acuta TaxID=109671 RepID=UPI0027DB5BC9|nr:peroxisome biogenesis factor 2-like [Physella acuta]
MDSGPVDALRVSQLDASELDQELVQLTKTQLSQLFKYHKVNFLARFEPEIQAAIKFLLWKFALYDSGATVGQQILGIYYRQPRKVNPGAGITGREKILYAFLVIICPWLKERIATLLSYCGLGHLESEVNWWLHHVETVVKVSTLINLLVFVKRGVYLTLVERVLGLRAQFPHRQGQRQVGYEYMTRELLWHGFSEFLFFLLPLINFQRIKNTVTRWVGVQRSNSQGHVRHRTNADLLSCAVCDQSPVMPREIGCRHVFCYYCVAANFSADPNYTCPQCGHPVVSQTNIQAVKHHINP